jgi:hypothetical protein
MQPTDLTFIDWLSIISSIFSIGLAILALWLSLRFFFSTNKSEKEATKLLTEIKTQTNLMQRVTGKMLDKYVTFSTTPQSDQTEVLVRLLTLTGTGPNSGLVNDQKSFDDKTVLKELTNLYIAVAYHSALTNIFLQEHVTDDITQLTEQVQNLLTITNHDFASAIKWIDQFGGDFVESVSTAAYYREINDLHLADAVCDPIEAVQRKAQSVE